MIPDPDPFLIELFNALKERKLDVSAFELDHICYRVETNDRYTEMKLMFQEHGRLLAESVVGGRAIATYRLNDPILFGGRRICAVELPSPKKGSPYTEGYEHAEFVVDEELLHFTERYPKLNWDLSGSRKKVNADVRLSLGTISVKFHCASLEMVIHREN